MSTPNEHDDIDVSKESQTIDVSIDITPIVNRAFYTGLILGGVGVTVVNVVGAFLL